MCGGEPRWAVLACCFLPGFGCCVPRRAGGACRFSAGRCGGELCRAAAAVSFLAFVVASRTVLSVRAGEGGGLILPALAKSAPTLPSPPRHPGTARCAACWIGDRKSGYLPPRLQCLLLCPRLPVQAHTGSHGQGVSRSDNLFSQCAEDGSPLERAQSEAMSFKRSNVLQAKQCPSNRQIERSNAASTQQTE